MRQKTELSESTAVYISDLLKKSDDSCSRCSESPVLSNGNGGFDGKVRSTRTNEKMTRTNA